MISVKRLTAIRRFVTAVACEKIRLTNDTDYCAMATFSGRKCYKKPTLGVPKDNLICALHDEAMKAFRKDFISRYSSAQGFANITLVLLHEVGHLKTGVQFWPDRAAEILDSMKREAAETQEEYMRIPSEYGATEWAIEWLKNEDNRALAKQFERQFFDAE